MSGSCEKIVGIVTSSRATAVVVFVVVVVVVVVVVFVVGAPDLFCITNWAFKLKKKTMVDVRSDVRSDFVLDVEQKLLFCKETPPFLFKIFIIF